MNQNSMANTVPTDFISQNEETVVPQCQDLDSSATVQQQQAQGGALSANGQQQQAQDCGEALEKDIDNEGTLANNYIVCQYFLIDLQIFDNLI